MLEPWQCNLAATCWDERGLALHAVASIQLRQVVDFLALSIRHLCKALGPYPRVAFRIEVDVRLQNHPPKRVGEPCTQCTTIFSHTSSSPNPGCQKPPRGFPRTPLQGGQESSLLFPGARDSDPEVHMNGPEPELQAATRMAKLLPGIGL